MHALWINTPQVRPIESIQGYLLRYAEANAYPTVEWLQRVDFVREHLRTLIGTALFGFVPKWLAEFGEPAIAPLAFEQRFCLGRRAKCCVACLSTAPYWRAIWEHRLYAACHIHGLELVDTCPACGSRINWNRSAMMRCRCGSEISSWMQFVASDANVDAARHIWCAFVRAVGPRQDIDGPVVSAVKELSLPSIASLITQLGVTTETTGHMLSPKAWRNLTVPETSRLVSVAYSRLSDWPLKFHEFLRDEDRSIDTSAATSARVSRLKKFLLHNLAPDLNFLLDGFRGYMRSKSMNILDRRRHWATTDDIQSQTYIAASVAAHRLGIRAATLHALTTRIGITEVRKPGGTKRHYTLIERTALSSLKEELSAEVSLRNMSLLLGISTSRVEQLSDVGLLTRRIVTRGLVSTSLFRSSEASRLVDSIKIPGSFKACIDQEIALTEVTQYFLSQRAEFISFIRALQESQIHLTRWDETARGLAGAILGRREFLHWHKQQCCSGGMTIPEVAIHLHVKQEVAYHLVQAGLLKGQAAVRGRRIVTLITADSLADFEQRYVTATELSNTMSLSPTKIASILSELGASPVSGPQTDGGRQNIFHREDIYRVYEALKAKIECHDYKSISSSDKSRGNA